MPAGTDGPAGVEYHRVLAGEKRRIGRGIIAIALLLAGMLVFAALLVGGAAAIDARWGNTGHTPLQHGAALASIALLTPWSMLIQRWLYGVRGASLHSVVSHVRFGLFGRALLLVGPLWVLVVVAQSAANGPGRSAEWSFATVIGFLAVTLLLTPLQSAGEEYGLRGLVFRVAGSWARGPRAGLVLGVVVSGAVFTIIHAATDPWLNLSYVVVAVALAIVSWRTGGIEVAIVVHAMNNTLSFLVTVALHDDLAESLANRSVGAVTAAGVLPSIGAVALVAAVVWLRTRQSGPMRTPRSAGRSRAAAYSGAERDSW